MNELFWAHKKAQYKYIQRRKPYNNNMTNESTKAFASSALEFIQYFDSLVLGLQYLLESIGNNLH